VILVPRQITFDRGIHLAIESFNLFNKELPGYTLLLLGEIRGEEYKKHCDFLIDKYQLQNQVVWKHGVKNDEIARYYSSACLTLIPTIRREGTSLSALESMACGCPTIVTNVAGLRDLPAYKVDPNPEKIKNAMIEVLKSPQKIIQEQQGAVSKIFNFKNWKNAWYMVINSISKST
jgi:glycosyltransferase involved in cell wall biosynthesis